MGSLYRSEDMVLCQMYLQSDAAYNTVAQLGELGIVQFRDLKAHVNIFQRQFVHEIRRCEEMERQLRYFEKELKKSDIPVSDTGFNPDTPAARDMVDLEAMFENTESELRELNTNVESLERNFMELQELKWVLHYTDDFFTQSSVLGTNTLHTDLRTQAAQEMELGGFDPSLDPGALRLQLNYVAGVIPVARIAGFTRILWFASRGNIFVRHFEIQEPLKDPATGDAVEKAVFMAVFQGEQLQSKVKKISEGFKATIYPCLDSFDERAEMTRGVLQRMSDLHMVLNKSRDQRNRTLTSLAQTVQAWNLKVIKLKAVYHAMNMFRAEGQNFICECWMPYAELGTVQAVLERSSEISGNRVASLVHPIEATVLPTYHKTNKFTKAFQAIIDAYGVANYKEVNPALFSIITFPFLFSVMFGDAGHALLMFAFALYLVLNENKLRRPAEQSEMFGIIFEGRYMILVMSLFSFYSGLIYNDVFSKSISIFHTKWHSNYSPDALHGSADFTLDPAINTTYGRVPYEFGVDPVWQLTLNKITFTNSYKKKISVIFGVSQMLLGILLSICNHVHFRHIASIFCEFIPQLIFLLAIFGYLCILIIAKWIAYNDTPEFYSCSPNILIDFINMFMMKYPAQEEGSPCKDRMYAGQQGLQTFLVLLAVICAIWMLLAKPLYLMRRNKQYGINRLVEETENGPSSPHVDSDTGRQLLTDRRPSDSGLTEAGRAGDGVTDGVSTLAPLSNGMQHKLTIPIEQEEPFDAGEVFIHQAIHTIEFCLGCVSHTASYLRLWALSLAHAQLSEVLWDMVMRSGFKMFPNYAASISVFIVFTPFAALTVVILLLMEGLSAFLHTLRLHWVEFNSKFYKGDGMAFEPFSFYEIISKRES